MMRFFLYGFLYIALHYPAYAQGNIERGKYILNMGGCISCHKTPKRKNADLAGGHALKTPFGTFYVPNITPDTSTGIGGWSDEDFINAMAKGVAPDGSHYYPAFPYTSYTKMKRQDLIDLKAYLDTVPPIQNAVPDHDLSFPFNMRFLMMGWKAMFFNEGEYKPIPDKGAMWNRGAYIVQGAGHCGECHTPRNQFGGLDKDKKFQGNPKGPNNEKIPHISPKNWTENHFITALGMGMTPDGDFLGGSMGLVIGKITSKLSAEDRKMVAIYLKSLQEK